MNTIWNHAFAQKLVPIAQQVSVYQPIQLIGQSIPQIPVPSIFVPI